MPSPLDVARRHAAFRRRLAKAAAAEAIAGWRLVDPGNIRASWLGQLARMVVLLTGAQRAVAGRADDYLDEVLAAQDVSAAAEGRVVASALAGLTSDGRDLQGLLYQPAVTTLTGIQRGAAPERALAVGRAHVEMIVRTQVADAGRVADGVALVARPRVGGYVRMLSLPSCSRCIVLGGRWYRYNAGFKRHPRCRPGRLQRDSLRRRRRWRPAYRPGGRVPRDGPGRAGPGLHGGRRPGDPRRC